MTLLQQEKMTSAMSAVTSSLNVHVENQIECTEMKTKRKHVLFHNHKRTCGNCNYYIYEDQEWILIGSGGNTQMPFHKDYQGCMDSQYNEEIRVGGRKGK